MPQIFKQDQEKFHLTLSNITLSTPGLTPVKGHLLPQISVY